MYKTVELVKYVTLSFVLCAFLQGSNTVIYWLAKLVCGFYGRRLWLWRRAAVGHWSSSNMRSLPHDLCSAIIYKPTSQQSSAPFPADVFGFSDKDSKLGLHTLVVVVPASCMHPLWCLRMPETNSGEENRVFCSFSCYAIYVLTPIMISVNTNYFALVTCSKVWLCKYSYMICLWWRCFVTLMECHLATLNFICQCRMPYDKSAGRSMIQIYVYPVYSLCRSK